MRLRDSAIISLNYDVIVDIALSKRADEAFNFQRANIEVLSEDEGPNIDYGVSFANLPPYSGSGERFKLLKLHGSFNWVASALTGNLYYGGLQKAVGSILEHRNMMEGQQLRAAQKVADMFGFFNRRSIVSDADAEIAALEPVLVTPTHLKDLRNHHLSLLWRNAEEVLRRAQRITFIGYSLPGEDLHIKYLFNHALETRYLVALPEIVVVDYHNTEREPLGSQVKANYRRFFGDITFHPHGLQQFLDRLEASVAAQ